MGQETSSKVLSAFVKRTGWAGGPAHTTAAPEGTQRRRQSVPSSGGSGSFRISRVSRKTPAGSWSRGIVLIECC